MNKLKEVCRQLNAYAICGVSDRASGGNPGRVIAENWNTNNGGERIIGCIPYVDAFLSTAGQADITNVVAPALLAGAIARHDELRGIGAPVSGIQVPSFRLPGGSITMGSPYQDTGTLTPGPPRVDTRTGAKALDEANIMTFVKRNGLSYTWGGTTKYASAEDDRRFISVGRVIDVLNKELTEVALSLESYGITENYLTNLVSYGNAVLSRHIDAGNLVAGTITLDAEANTDANLRLGKVYLIANIVPAYPVRLVTYSVGLTSQGLADAVGRAFSDGFSPAFG